MSDAPRARDYLLGSSDGELRRLADQHDLWADAARAVWDRAGFGPGQVLADLGCGPGFATIELARRVGRSGRIIAVDSSPKFIGHLDERIRAEQLDGIETRCADLARADLGRESLDGAYARWLMCFLDRPDKLVAAVARALRPGGTFAVTDYFNYRAFTFAPRSAALDRAVDAVQRSWRERGGDLEVQGRMPAIMRGCGLRVVEVRCDQRVARPGDPMWNWPREFFASFGPVLVEMSLLGEADLRALLAEWDNRAEDAGSFLNLPPMYDVIGVKPG